MPQVDATYVIGVIRERERALLEEDEFLRLEDGPRALVDTVYGKWYEAGDSLNQAEEALSQRLQDSWNWLSEVVQDKRVLEFLRLRSNNLGRANQRLKSADKTAQEIMAEIAEQASAERHRLAFTPLMKWLAQYEDDKWEEAKDLRENGGDKASFEKVWDEKLIARLKEEKMGVSGYDPVIAYWLVLELEVKNIRLTLAGEGADRRSLFLGV